MRTDCVKKVAAKINGYDESFVTKIFQKHQRIQQTRQRTTLAPFSTEKKLICLPFFQKVTNPLTTILQKRNIHVVTRNHNTLMDNLCNYKDKENPISTPGIYQISCKDCDMKYRGQSRRPIKERIKEHKTNNRHTWKSSVSEHIIESI